MTDGLLDNAQGGECGGGVKRGERAKWEHNENAYSPSHSPSKRSPACLSSKQGPAIYGYRPIAQRRHPDQRSATAPRRRRSLPRVRRKVKTLNAMACPLVVDEMPPRGVQTSS